MGQAEDFDTDISLPALSVEVWNGWVFVNAAAQPEPLAPTLSELDAHLAPYQPGELKTAGVLHYHSPWNWKVLVENFMESYHHMGPHSETLNPIYPHNSTYPMNCNGNYTLLENPSVDESASASFWVGLVFQLTMFAISRYDTTPILGWYQMQIHSVDSFDLNIHVLTPQSMIDDGSAQGAVDMYGVVHGEDIPVCEGVWKGVQSSYYEPGRLSHLEGCIWDFHAYLKKKLT